MTRMDLDDAIKDLMDLGYVEDSGERRADGNGVMQPAYQISALGHVADVYLRQRFTFEEAMDLARSAHKGDSSRES